MQFVTNSFLILMAVLTGCAASSAESSQSEADITSQKSSTISCQVLDNCKFAQHGDLGYCVERVEVKPTSNDKATITIQRLAPNGLEVYFPPLTFETERFARG